MDIDSFEPTSMKEVEEFITDVLELTVAPLSREISDVISEEVKTTGVDGIYSVHESRLLLASVDKNNLPLSYYDRNGLSVNFEDIIDSQKDIYNSKGVLVLEAIDSCDYCYKPIIRQSLIAGVAYSCILERLTTLIPLDNYANTRINEIYIIVSEETRQILNGLLSEIYEDIKNFVKGNYSYIYTVRMSLYSFYLVKRMDSRIYGYYTNIFNKG